MHKKTKVVCTIGPATQTYEQLVKLAENGMNVARLNMSHGDHEWHGNIIKLVKKINEKGDFSIAIMLDTKGPEVRIGNLSDGVDVKVGDEFVFTTDYDRELKPNEVTVSYDLLAEDAEVGDIILIEGGIISFNVVRIDGKNIYTRCVDPGKLTSKRHLNIRGKTPRMESITDKDWEDLKFGVEQGVDFFAMSLIKDAAGIQKVRKFVDENNAPIDIVAKIESADAIPHLEEIIVASDGAMVARGDLGFELTVEEVPIIQDQIINLCRKHNKPVIVATQMLESMMENPIPTRAEVSDIANAVKARADAIMLSGETAGGKYPIKAVSTMSSVARKIETYLPKRQYFINQSNESVKDELVQSAAIMANNLNAKAILVFTRSGAMATLLAQARPDSELFAFTNTSHVRRRLNLYWGLKNYRIDFSNSPEKTIQRALDLLKEKGRLAIGDRIVLVSDIVVDDEFVNTIQIRQVAK